MQIEDAKIAAEIINRFSRDMLQLLELDVAIAGAGPSGLTAARYLARGGAKVAVFERRLYTGGGTWGGGMLFPRVVIQEPAKSLAEEIGVKLEPGGEGYYTADSVEAASKLSGAAVDAGAKILVGLAVEDVLIRERDRIAGVVVNWSAVESARMHVDPVGIESKLVIDASGHEAGIARIVERKVPGARFPTRTGGVVGEKPMWAEVGEKEILENTREIYPGLIVTGMASATVFGTPRMGPIFGGMLLSGKKAAEIALEKLRG